MTLRGKPAGRMTISSSKSSLILQSLQSPANKPWKFCRLGTVMKKSAGTIEWSKELDGSDDFAADVRSIDSFRFCYGMRLSRHTESERLADVGHGSVK